MKTIVMHLVHLLSLCVPLLQMWDQKLPACLQDAGKASYLSPDRLLDCAVELFFPNVPKGWAAISAMHIGCDWRWLADERASGF